MFQCIFASKVLWANCFIYCCWSDWVVALFPSEAERKRNKSWQPEACLRVAGRVDLNSQVVPDKQGIFPKSLTDESQVTGGWGLSNTGPQTCWHLKVFCSWLVDFATTEMKLLTLYPCLEANAWEISVVWKLCSLWWGKSQEASSQ